MRAVYIAIILGFFRRLLGRVLVPSGGHRDGCRYVLRLYNDRGERPEDGVAIEYPYIIPDSALDGSNGVIAKVWDYANKLPGELDFWLVREEGNITDEDVKDIDYCSWKFGYDEASLVAAFGVLGELREYLE